MFIFLSVLHFVNIFKVLLFIIYKKLRLRSVNINNTLSDLIKEKGSNGLYKLGILSRN